MEDLKEKNAQMETELGRLAGELGELSKKQAEAAIGMEVRLTNLMAEQIKEVNKSFDSKMEQLSLMVERSLRQSSGKGPNDARPETSTRNEGPRGEAEGHSRNVGRGNGRQEEEDGGSIPQINEEEYNWVEEMLRRNNGRGEIQFRLPKMDFPHFDGGDPTKWKMNCELYFEMYSIPGIYRSRMAILNFSEDVLEWYMSIATDGQMLPWEVLSEEVMASFKTCSIKHPVDEFKRLHQLGRVEEYYKKFVRAKARLLRAKPTLDEDFFMAGFISGLKEDIKNTVELFYPRSLNSAYQYALKVEANQDSQQKRSKELVRPSKFQKYPQAKPKFEGEKRIAEEDMRENQYQKQWQPWQNRNNNQTMTFQQRRALGLCDKCNEKYFPGHKCAGRMMGIASEPIIDEVEEEEEGENGQEEEVNEEHTTVEQAVISMYASTDKKKVSSMKFRGQIGKVPICALLDSGSTHTFVNPEILSQLELPLSQSNPMVVMVANGEKMVTDTICNSLNFSLQGHEFEKDVRLLAIQGYDMILGLDWLTSLGPMKIDWSKGILEFNKGNKEVKLTVREEFAEVQLVKGIVNVEKEVKKGNDVIIAQIFRIEEGKEEPKLNSEWQVVVDEFKDVFDEPKGLPPQRGVDHKINLLPESKPVNQRPYRFSYFQKLELEKIIEELLKGKLIQESDSPYASPVLLVKKKDGGWRMCIDYRQLNTQTVKNKFPIPIIEDILDELKGAEYFTKIDLRSGYHQIRMHEGDIHKTAFRTHQGHYEFLVMPFGLTNAPATFQALMNKVFKPYLRKFILVFFDDILIYSNSLAEHEQHLRMTLEILRQHKLFAKKSKCEFGARKLEYLGHLISSEGVATDPKKIEAMVNWPTPKTVKALRGFLGLTGYY
ncbi:hypothetical protein LUZ61_011586 [Rhynchospora tenuis]|uniref:Reverse transcriptase domain-containing protein n=1 Tax=Rhynchospora tenuis TaxID=198213 RepID=A0AAD6A1A5_9POAL|nr:hypothetical protein LUZ61_011586 [Rhynchospora tenuis]